jgi:hypothetical protein
MYNDGLANMEDILDIPVDHDYGVDREFNGEIAEHPNVVRVDPLEVPLTEEQLTYLGNLDVALHSHPRLQDTVPLFKACLQKILEFLAVNQDAVP